MKALSNYDIDAYYKNVKKYGGCYSKDQLLKKKIANKCYVINMQTSTKGQGSHWIAVLNCNPSETVYFDSFGQANAPLDIERFISSSKKIIVRNVVDLQHIMSDSCGEFCIYFINHAIQGVSFKNTLKHFTSNPVINEHILKSYFGKEAFTKKTLESSIRKHKLSGEGIREVINYVSGKINHIKDRITNAISGQHRLNFPPRVRSLLDKYGNEKIVNIKVCRQPIHAILDKILNWLTLGTFHRNLQDLGYDSALHLFALIKLSNGTVIKIEKNHVVDIKVVGSFETKAESTEVGSLNNTLYQFLQNGVKSVGPEKYFIYDSKTQNCQYFIKWNLAANGLWNNNAEKFVMQ
ncbi:hypothetical protein, partial [Clostridium sp.]|uniref:hypothetical protein n=1 Tax=Clostridium sp. TaxID=1506 RepID=UPI00284263CC